MSSDGIVGYWTYRFFLAIWRSMKGDIMQGHKVSQVSWLPTHPISGEAEGPTYILTALGVGYRMESGVTPRQEEL